MKLVYQSIIKYELGICIIMHAHYALLKCKVSKSAEICMKNEYVGKFMIFFEDGRLTLIKT